jgi:osmotically-inducible protein OsmY
VRAKDEDARIAARVASRLARHESLKDVTVAVYGGVVVLSGTAVGDADRKLAESIAASVEGVIGSSNGLPSTPAFASA